MHKIEMPHCTEEKKEIINNDDDHVEKNIHTHTSIRIDIIIDARVRHDQIKLCVHTRNWRMDDAAAAAAAAMHREIIV